MEPPSASAADYDESLPVEIPPFLRRQTFLRRAAGAAHRDALGLHRLARVGGAVALVLKAAARVPFALERARVALLLVGAAVLVLPLPASEHAGPVPVRRPLNPALHWPRSTGPIRLVA